MDKNYKCKLCNNHMKFFSTTRNRDYYRCPNCDSIQLHENYHLEKNSEKQRYENHNNDVFDRRYQEFVSPITNYVFKHFYPNHIGLDYGAGPGPVISKILKDHHYQIKQYDPFFHDNSELLKQTYDYIIACEVIEHFNYPNKEFSLLKKSLNNNGSLIIMTHIYKNEIDFDKWYYKNDETHIIFYTEKTLNYIKKTYNFKNLEINNRLIVFK